MEPRTTPAWIRTLGYGAVGALLAAAGLAIGAVTSSNPDGGLAAASASTTVPTAEPFIAAGEALLANTALVAVSVHQDDGNVEVGYVLHPLGADHVTAAPENWELRAGGVVYESRTASQTAERVRFSDVAGTPEELLVTQWRFQTSLRYPLDLPLTGSVTLDDGTELSVERLIEQSTGTIVQFTVDLADRTQTYGSDEFIGGPIVAGRGSGWLEGDWVNLERLNPGSGFGAAQLVWVDGPVPEVLSLEVVSAQWTPQTERIPITLPGER